MTQIGAILLAAGESKRMGTPKQLLTYQGKTLIRHTITELIAANCDPIVVVLGAYSDRIGAEIKDLPVYICHNPHWQQGMSSSIVKGVEVILKINCDLEAVIISLVDQPLITAKLYKLLIANYLKSQTKASCVSSSKAIASIYANTIGVPALFSHTLFDRLLKLQHQGGAKQLLKIHSDPQFNLDLPQAAIDLDTPQDYQNLLDL